MPSAVCSIVVFRSLSKILEEFIVSSAKLKCKKDVNITAKKCIWTSNAREHFQFFHINKYEAEESSFHGYNLSFRMWKGWHEYPIMQEIYEYSRMLSKLVHWFLIENIEITFEFFHDKLLFFTSLISFLYSTQAYITNH